MSNKTSPAFTLYAAALNLRDCRLATRDERVALLASASDVDERIGLLSRVYIDACATEAGAEGVAEELTAALLLSVESGHYARYVADKADESKTRDTRTPAPRALTLYVVIRRGADAAEHGWTIAKAGGSDDPCFVPAERKLSNQARKGERNSKKKGAKRAPDTTLSAEMKRIVSALGIEGDERAVARMVADAVTARAAEFASWLATPAPAARKRAGAAKPAAANLH